MNDLPLPTPAGKLLRRERELAVPKLGRPEVAHRAGVDPGTLGNIERGYRHLGNGKVREVAGDADVIAKVARVLNITPQRLREAERDDAADALEEILRAGSAREPAAEPDDEAMRKFPGDTPHLRLIRNIWRLARWGTG